jgi:hypothetical protein
MTKIPDSQPSVMTSPAPAVHTPLALHQGFTMPTGATAPKGTGAPTAGLRASGGNVQGQAGRMAVVDRYRLADVPGVLPRGVPV